MKTYRLPASLLAALLLPTALCAATVNGVLNKDTMAKEHFPADPFGSDVELQVSAQTGYQKIAFLQFTVSGIPAGATGISAQLKLRCTAGGTSRPITAHAVTSTSWTEAGLTWNNKPALGTALSTVSTHTAGADSVWAVGAHVTGNGTFAIGLDTTFSGDTKFSSKEGATAPVLVVTYTPPPTYSIYRGNTHSHTSYTWSHGAQYDANGNLRPDWQNYQGPPSEHHARAKAAGFDFYATSDHSQETTLDPTSLTNAAWVDTKNAAAAATDSTYLGIAGFEFSENNQGVPNANRGTGHINVFNTNAYLDASEAPDLPYLYGWLPTAAVNGSGPVFASFNHPSDTQYNNWAYRTTAATDMITLLEVVSSGDTSKETAYRAANNAGWKVAPTCGIDNHGFDGITAKVARVGVLATALTKAAILDALKNRRTFASLDINATLHYTVNGGIMMGQTLSSPSTITFTVTASDPNTGDPADKITAIEIVDPAGTVVASTAVSTYSTVWTSPAVSVSGKKYFYVRMRNSGSGTAPMAWAAPIWTGL